MAFMKKQNLSITRLSTYAVIHICDRIYEKGSIAFPIVCTWPFIVWQVSMVATWNLVTLQSQHGSIAEKNFKSIGQTHYEL